MDHALARFLRRTGALPDAVIAALDAAGVDAALAQGRLPELPPGTLQAVVEGWTAWHDLAAADPELAGAATMPGCALALPRDAPGPPAQALVRLEGAVRRAIEGGSVIGRATRAGHPGLAAYAAHVDHVELLGDISAHRWLALERGEADGVLRREYRFPADLGAPPWTLALLPRCVAAAVHRRARAEAVWAAADVLTGLLTAPPRRELLAAVARAGGQTAVVVRAPDGAARSRAHAPLGEAAALVAAARARHAPAAVVLPASGLDLAALRLPAAVETILVSTAGLHAAAEAFPGPRVEALALALAERAQDPRGAWGRLAPARLGLVEYQGDLEPAYVGLVLGLARAAAAPQRARLAAPPGPALPAVVRTLDDLRPGMLVSGTVTQIAPFGAFVNFGVGRDGLVHVSELADARVERPTEVVQIGQRVTARVLEVDRARGRIALSLRTNPRPPRGDRARATALDALKKLFDK
ncbi:MAG TPA: S1 RNA-binding domain-containing protein [Polyangia bacterium]|jgi:predicted RNA-binding protein with RPS1 domain